MLILAQQLTLRKLGFSLLAPHHPYIEPSVATKGDTLNAVDNFTYLGRMLCRDANIDDEVDSWIARASLLSIWEGWKEGIREEKPRLPMKLKVYRAIVLTSMLYIYETWTAYQHHAMKLNHFYLNCLGKILKITW